MPALDQDASKHGPDSAGVPAPSRLGGLAASSALPALIVVALTALGVALRLAVAHQSLFADELSTYWIVSHNDFGGVISTVHGGAEAEPPLYFVLSWLMTRVELTPELLRAPSLIAGAAAIPLTYLLGLKTVGRAAALVATAVVSFSPFMVFFSAQARGYELMLALVLCSTLAMLVAIDTGRARWWIVYGASSCAAVYAHYPAVFALGAQLAWLLWAHPEARRPALIANVAAALAFLPWYSGVLNDVNSPLAKYISSTLPFTADRVEVTLEHWAIGYPHTFASTEVRDLPGTPAVLMLVLAAGIGVVGFGVAWLRGRGPPSLFHPNPRLVLLLVLAASSIVGVAVMSAVGTNLLAVRFLAASWPAFALSLAALILAAGPRLWLVGAALVVASFAIGGATLLESRFQRPDYEAAVAFVDRNAAPGDVIIDASPYTPTTTTGIDAALDRPGNPLLEARPGKPLLEARSASTGPVRVFHARLYERPTTVVGQAIMAARAHRIFVVSFADPADRTGLLVTLGNQVRDALAAQYRPVEKSTYPGILGTAVTIFAARGGSPRG